LTAGAKSSVHASGPGWQASPARYRDGHAAPARRAAGRAEVAAQGPGGAGAPRGRARRAWESVLLRVCQRLAEVPPQGEAGRDRGTRLAGRPRRAEDRKA